MQRNQVGQVNQSTSSGEYNNLKKRTIDAITYNSLDWLVLIKETCCMCQGPLLSGTIRCCYVEIDA
jgi:hypothetical protein